MFTTTIVAICIAVPIMYVFCGMLVIAFLEWVEQPMNALWREAFGRIESTPCTAEEERSRLRFTFWVWPIWALFCGMGTIIAVVIVFPVRYMEWIESKPWQAQKTFVFSQKPVPKPPLEDL